MTLSGKRISVIGLGLIGGSIVKALFKIAEQQDITLAGLDRNPQNTSLAMTEGVISRTFDNLEELARNSDVIIIATPIGAVKSIFEGLSPGLSPETLITDACSAKQCIIDDYVSVFGDLNPNFVPAHPISGKETSGFGVSESSLFLDKRLIITPHENSNPCAVQCIQNMWSAIGARVEVMGAGKHDEIFALTSHVPHFLTYAMMEMMAKHHPDLPGVLNYTGGGFKDFIRIAKSDPDMWSDIALNNKEPILSWLRNYQSTLDGMIKLIESDNQPEIRQVISRSQRNLM